MIPRLIGEVILWVLLGLLIADGLGSGIAVLELKRKKGRIEQITEELQKTSKFLENALNLRKDADFLNWRVCLSSEHLSGI